MHRASVSILCTLGVVMLCAAAQNDSKPMPQQNRRIVIATDKLLDGRGHVVPATRIVIENYAIFTADRQACVLAILEHVAHLEFASF